MQATTANNSRDTTTSQLKGEIERALMKYATRPPVLLVIVVALDISGKVPQPKLWGLHLTWTAPMKGFLRRDSQQAALEEEKPAHHHSKQASESR